MKRDVRVSVLVFKDDKLLVVNMKRKDSDIYVLAGGGLEAGESIFQAGVREVFEETGLLVKIVKLAYIKELYTDDSESMDFVLLGVVVKGELVKGYDPEYEEQFLNDVRFVDFDELKILNFHPRQLVDRLKEDFRVGFFGETIHLGRFKYPEVNK
jgi:8-oxo-dGTP diphosphatase